MVARKVKKINLKNIIWLFLGIMAGFALAHINLNNQNRYVVTEITSTAQASTSPYPDTLYQDYESLLKSQDLKIIHKRVENLTGSGTQTVITVIGMGCGSCHYNEIHIYDNNKEIFVFYGEDTNLIPIKGFGFIISQPVYKGNYSARSEYESAVYLWNGQTFVKSKTSPNWVDSTQTPG